MKPPTFREIVSIKRLLDSRGEGTRIYYYFQLTKLSNTRLYEDYVQSSENFLLFRHPKTAIHRIKIHICWW